MRGIILCISALLSLLPHAAVAQSPAGFGRAHQLSAGWLFALSDDSTALHPDFDDSHWTAVRVPHDWGVTLPMSPDRGSCQGYLHGGIGWYRRHITPAELQAASRHYVYFEGVYNRSTVYLNGHLLGHRPSGFASFLYDLTPYLRTDADNVLAVRVDHSRQDDSRWYTGSGIYRPVWLVAAADTHFALWGTTWKLKSICKAKAVVEVGLEIASEQTASAQPQPRQACTIAVEVVDADGKVVATSKAAHTLTVGATSASVLSLSIPHPKRWTLTTPYLYNVRARLLMHGHEVDVTESPLGLRTLQFSPEHGFALNDEWMKVKGVCLHDDAGVLGTAVPTAVWRERLLTLKSLGVNAIRMSHNPHAPSLYALCDTLGLLVMDEASDEWEFPKRKWLEGWNRGTPGYEGSFDYFNEWIDRDVADMVRRDRRHPSIFLWSIGNEVDYPNDPYSHPVLDHGGSDFTQPMYGGYKPQQPNAERIGTIAQRLAAVVRSHDGTRAVTGALAGVVMSNETAYPEAVDVVGYNYTESRYDDDHRRYPRRVIYGSENRHDLAAWQAVTTRDHIFGQFLWTGIDYLGESGAWPARGSEAGLLDLAGHIKPNGYYRASLWACQPVCYIGAYPVAPQRRAGRRTGSSSQRERQDYVSAYAPAVWNFSDGQPVRVVCYTNAPTATLTLHAADGKDTIFAQPSRRDGILYWDIDYRAGRLDCQANDVNGKALATAALQTSGRPAALRIVPRQQWQHRDRQPLSSYECIVADIEVVDDDGHHVTLADNDITVTVSGAHLLGLENADVRDTSCTSASRHRRAHGGRLTAYIEPDSSAAEITMHAAAPLLEGAVQVWSTE